MYGSRIPQLFVSYYEVMHSKQSYFIYFLLDRSHIQLDIAVQFDWLFHDLEMLEIYWVSDWKRTNFGWRRRIHCKKTVRKFKHIVWKLLKMSHYTFWVLAFFTNFCSIESDLSGNTVWPQASGFEKLAKMDNFWHFQFTFVHSKWKRNSLRLQCWMRLFLWFSNTVHRFSKRRLCLLDLLCVLFLWVTLAFHAFFQPQFLRVNELITNRLAIVEETTC